MPVLPEHVTALAAALVSEKLVYLPARLVVRQTSRDKARCLDCGRLSTAMQPAKAVKHGQLDASVLASLIHSKFALHLPIERILEDWRRMGHTLASSSAQTALAQACKLLEPIYAELQRRALSSDVLHWAWSARAVGAICDATSSSACRTIRSKPAWRWRR